MRRYTLISAGVITCLPLAGTVGTPPAIAREQSPGAVVSSTALPRDLWLPGTGKAYRVTYVSTGPAGRRALSGGAVFVPAGKAPQGGWPVLSWAHGTVGLGDGCAPSTAGRSERDIGYLAKWMAQGYAVVATDYVGLGTPGVHPYLDGRTAAHSVTDMVRAARKIDKSLARRWIAIGQSQGGHATLFTASLATRYAPELDFRGAVTTGAPSNLAQVFSLAGPYIPDLPLGGLVPYTAYIMAGLEAARPGFSAAPYLTPAGRSAVRDARTLCYADLKERMAGLSIGKMLNRPLFDARFYQVASSVLDVPLSGYDRPLYLAQGTNDLDVPIPLTLKLVADLKARGVKFTFKPYPGADHSATMAASLPDTMPYVAKLFR